jgi:hypothetical protein
MWLLGTSHFVITLTIYLQIQNIRYFNRDWTNRLLYFVVPLGIFVVFDLYTALQIAVIAPGFDRIFRACIRLMDNYHVTRQGFGVSQLFKKRSGQTFPLWIRSAEDAYFHMLTALLLLTFFAGGRFNLRSPLMLAGAAITLALALAILTGYGWMLRHSADRKSLSLPIAYFLLQSGSMALGIYRTSLYIYCLTMHYVEYHVLMAPRCFDAKLDASCRTDRAFERLRRNRFFFYGVVLVLAGAATYLTWINMGWLMTRTSNDWPTPYRLLLAVFDGLFVFHYFIEALIWKFGNPFYRATLGPLYFGRGGPKPPAVSPAATS